MKPAQIFKGRKAMQGRYYYYYLDRRWWRIGRVRIRRYVPGLTHLPAGTIIYERVTR